ncbi:MAG: NADH dehydrogenase subunit [Chlorobiaceae bacterium]|nr:NADH dehydrogenase subunit [Chlorobiaceae bacterium]MBA4310647.1 NADH dehydrogenase subunit [Chlorobiaceae bacterium]
MTKDEKIFYAGVVGAGGAGFPSHVKAKSKVEFVLANGAECEPLIHKDFELMVHHAEEIVNGFNTMIESTEAKKGYFGIKTKNAEAKEEIEKYLQKPKTQITNLGDFYPSGDEYELVYEATKRLIPAGGIPLQVGCVVNNVETFFNISNALKDIPVTEKFVCVAGAVKEPASFWAPIGTTYEELIKHVGGTTVSDFGLFVGGVMMGSLTFDLSEVVTKTTAGLIVLPKDHYLIRRKNQPEKNFHRIGKSACDQCSYCTEFCPRYLLGYDVQPHKVMRSLGFSKTGSDIWNQSAELCCACGLCTLYACPEDLFPKEACDKSKVDMKVAGIKYIQQKPVKVHPMKDGRRVPLKQLIKKLNLQSYDVHAPYMKSSPSPSSVKIMLKQHIGEKSISIVKIGQSVKKGELIGKAVEGKLGANIHSSIDGKVSQVSDDFIRIIL